MLTATTVQELACQQSAATALDSAACLLAAFRRLGVPASMLDVGCGNGHLVRIARVLGVHASGVDIAVEHQPYRNADKGDTPGDGFLWPLDLTKPVPDLRPYDLVLCLEVAEHLPPESAGTLCDTLAAATGKSLLFSAATPGQGGAGHLHEAPHDHWRGMLTVRGLVEDGELTADLRHEWSALAPRAWWYGRNVMAFRGAA